MLQKENKNHFLSLFHAKVYSELQVIYNIMYLFFTTAHLSSSFFLLFLRLGVYQCIIKISPVILTYTKKLIVPGYYEIIILLCGFIC